MLRPCAGGHRARGAFVLIAAAAVVVLVPWAVWCVVLLSERERK